MATLHSTYIKLETLKTIVKTLEHKGEKGIEITTSIDDETNTWGQNTSSYVSQTKEQREAKAQRFYIGNGKVFWTDGKVVKAEPRDKQQEQGAPAASGGQDEDDLPF